MVTNLHLAFRGQDRRVTRAFDQSCSRSTCWTHQEKLPPACLICRRHCLHRSHPNRRALPCRHPENPTGLASLRWRRHAGQGGLNLGHPPEPAEQGIIACGRNPGQRTRRDPEMTLSYGMRSHETDTSDWPNLFPVANHGARVGTMSVSVVKRREMCATSGGGGGIGVEYQMLGGFSPTSTSTSISTSTPPRQGKRPRAALPIAEAWHSEKCIKGIDGPKA